MLTALCLFQLQAARESAKYSATDVLTGIAVGEEPAHIWQQRHAERMESCARMMQSGLSIPALSGSIGDCCDDETSALVRTHFSCLLVMEGTVILSTDKWDWTTPLDASLRTTLTNIHMVVSAKLDPLQYESMTVSYRSMEMFPYVAVLQGSQDEWTPNSEALIALQAPVANNILPHSPRSSGSKTGKPGSANTEKGVQYWGVVIQSSWASDNDGCYVLKTMRSAVEDCTCVHYSLVSVCQGEPYSAQMAAQWLTA